MGTLLFSTHSTDMRANKVVHRRNTGTSATRTRGTGARLCTTRVASTNSTGNMRARSGSRHIRNRTTGKHARGKYTNSTLHTTTLGRIIVRSIGSMSTIHGTNAVVIAAITFPKTASVHILGVDTGFASIALQ